MKPSTSGTSGISSKVVIPAGASADLYRTKICNFYKRGEECKYREKCFFAHGDKELRPLVSRVKFAFLLFFENDICIWDGDVIMLENTLKLTEYYSQKDITIQRRMKTKRMTTMTGLRKKKLKQPRVNWQSSRKRSRRQPI